MLLADGEGDAAADGGVLGRGAAPAATPVLAEADFGSLPRAAQRAEIAGRACGVSGGCSPSPVSNPPLDAQFR